PGQPSLVAPIPQNVITIEELISNRFGEPDSATNSNGAVCLANGISCTDSNKCCSRYCAQATLNSRVCIARSNEVPHTPDGLPPRGPSVDPPSTEAPPPTGCQAIGAKVSVLLLHPR
uniref:Uncharacterized protein n=1 Tax=Phlebotomus papatasi TaxID=29031 RepID=A0A1B0DFQ6_PHLPP